MYQEVRDFKKWLVFNARGNDKTWVTQLTEVLKNRKPRGPFSISEGDWGAGWNCRITEEGNEECLLLSKDDIYKMITYLEEHYMRSGTGEPSTRETDTRAPQEEETTALTSPADTGSAGKIKKPSAHPFYAILSKLSSANIGQHALIYGFLTLLLMQPIIITTNFKLVEPDNILEALLFIPILLMSYLSVVSYSRTYHYLRRFWDVFKLCLLHNVVLALMITMELTIIDLINTGDTSMPATIAIMFLFLAGALILTFPISLVTYFIRLIAKKGS